MQKKVKFSNIGFGWGPQKSWTLPHVRVRSAVHCFWLSHTDHRCSTSTAGLRWRTPPSRAPEKVKRNICDKF